MSLYYKSSVTVTSVTVTDLNCIFKKVLSLWFIAANMYYGVVLISTELLNSSSDTCGGSVDSLVGVNGSQNAYDEEVECSLHKCRYILGYSVK